MKPIIAVTACCEKSGAELKHEYAECITRAGGIPVTLPFIEDPADIAWLCGLVDGLLLTGGPDLDPEYFGEEPLPGLGKVTPARDRLEVPLIREILKRDKPLFAICRGIQVLNATIGGTLYQDIESQCAGAIQHRQNAPGTHMSHYVRVVKHTLLQRILETDRLKVNSFHHQAVKNVAPSFRSSAASSDGIIEAIESERHAFALGVQWHPEETAAADSYSRKLFYAFVQACSDSKEQAEKMRSG